MWIQFQKDLIQGDKMVEALLAKKYSWTHWIYDDKNYIIAHYKKILQNINQFQTTNQDEYIDQELESIKDDIYQGLDNLKYTLNLNNKSNWKICLIILIFIIIILTFFL